MKVLAEMPTGMGGRYVLVEYGKDFYAYGYEQNLHTLTGFPVNQCGTKDDVLAHCKSIAKLCKQNIEKFQRNKWEILIEHEQKQLEALMEFSSVLSC